MTSEVNLSLETTKYPTHRQRRMVIVNKYTSLRPMIILHVLHHALLQKIVFPQQRSTKHNTHQSIFFSVVTPISCLAK